MAKTKEVKKNSILIRDLSDETIKGLEFFKNRNGIKTNSGAVVLMVQKTESYIKKIDDLQERFDAMERKATSYWLVLSELQDAQNQLMNLKFED